LAKRPALKPGERATLPPPTQYTPKWGQSVSKPVPAKSPGLSSSDNPGLASERLRAAMVARLTKQGISDERVLKAMGQTLRHRFVDDALASRAYEDTALPIGFQQTISQPYVVARSQALALAYCQVPDGPQVALEVGTGCGYQAAVMASLYPTVVSVERIAGLHELAKDNLTGMGLDHLRLVLGDGLVDAQAFGPFDVIVLAAGMADIPGDLLRQLRLGGVMVAPLGQPEQRLQVVRRSLDPFAAQPYQMFLFESVAFVPILRGIQT
jgi:protein-L-isoaspartate(D-aspartate) O-methyltransferase